MNSCPYAKIKSPLGEYKACNKECPILSDKPLCRRWDLCSSARHYNTINLK